VAVWVVEIDTPPTIIVVDLAGAAAHRVGPVFEALLANAAQDSVEVGLADQEA